MARQVVEQLWCMLAWNIDNAFRMAGLPVGRPTTAKLELLRKRNILPGDSESLVNLFSDEQVRAWQLQIGETANEIADADSATIPGWQEFMAAYILEYLGNAGITTDGGSLDVTSVDSGTFSRDFLDSDTTCRTYLKRANELRSTARRLGDTIRTTRSTIPGSAGPLGPVGPAGSMGDKVDSR